MMNHEAPVMNLRLIDWNAWMGRILDGSAGLQICIPYNQTDLNYGFMYKSF